jgi:hypothetical protein
MALAISFNSSAQFYSPKIYSNVLDNATLKESINDFASVLAQATSQKFVVLPYTQFKEPGIYILCKEYPIAPPQPIQKVEAHLIAGNNQQLLLAAAHTNGLQHALYSYLDTLGIKFYFPGAIWTHIPNLKTNIINYKKTIEPLFDGRQFFGTGGIIYNKGQDVNNTVKQQWDLWKQRNRMGGSITLGGHAYQLFYSDEKKIIAAHPEYMAQINGKRVAPSESAKICISNEAMRKDFIAWRLKNANKDVAALPTKFDKLFYSVDPSDGGDHCTCAPCTKMGSISDRVFLLANETAKAAQKIDSRIHINLYAYNDHAAPPKQALEKNVMVQIIPYAFQNVATPEKFIQLWKQKNVPLSVYNYYALPDWYYNNFFTGKENSPAALQQQILGWLPNGIQAYNVESSTSIGSAGIGLWLFGQYGWHKKAANGMVEEMWRNLFPQSQKTISSLFNKFWSKPYKETVIGDIALEQLQIAYTQTNNKLEQDRIVLFQKYFYFIKLFQKAKSLVGTAAAPSAWQNFMQFIWQIDKDLMVHTSRMNELTINQTQNADGTNAYNVYEQSKSAIPSIGYMDNATFLNVFKSNVNMAKSIKQSDIEASINSFTIKDNKTKNTVWHRTYDETVLEWQVGNEKQLNLNVVGYDLYSTKAPNKRVWLKIESATGSIVFKDSVTIGADVKNFSYKVLPNTKYLILVSGAPHRIKIPLNQYVYTNKINYYQLTDSLYVYVPAGRKRIIFTQRFGDGIVPKFIDEKGKVYMPAQIEGNMYEVVLPEKTPAQFWLIKPETKSLGLEFIQEPKQIFFHKNFVVK